MMCRSGSRNTRELRKPRRRVRTHNHPGEFVGRVLRVALGLKVSHRLPKTRRAHREMYVSRGQIFLPVRNVGSVCTIRCNCCPPLPTANHAPGKSKGGRGISSSPRTSR